MVWEKTLEDPLDSKEIKPVNPKGNQHIDWTDAEADWSSNTLATWLMKNWLIGKDPDAFQRKKAGGARNDRV